AVTANAKPAVLLNVCRQPDSNTVAVADAVHAEVDQIRRDLPKGVDLQPFYDQSNIVNDSITSVRDAVLIGLVLASLIMALFLRGWGTSLVAGLVIPATLAVTFVVLRVLGESFNLMTLGGLAAAVGLVIDDAIVVVENIVMHRDAGQSRADAIRSAIAEIRVPLVGSTITPIVVFLPLMSITGVTGTFYRALGSDLLPAMDEGGFIIDYIMPAGSSLAETNGVLTGVEQILRSTPEVEGTSRRTGLQLGLAAVTETNTGDVSVKLKRDRKR